MTLKIDGERLWSRLMDMAEIGATPAGGCNRQALTDEDKRGRDLFCQWAREAGCEIRVDAMGNIFARRAGRNKDAAPVISGSHLDTQPTGGKFDGVYGVLAALEVIESLNDHDIETEHPFEAVVWTNEEGARFAPAMIGSGVFCGEFELDFAHAIADKEEKTIGSELSRIGYDGDEPCVPFPIQASYEVHIEQGPILEAKDKPVGIVTGVQGMRWFDIVIDGSPVHAGPTPMEMRQDPVRALHKIIDRIYELTEKRSPDSRATFGDIIVSPGSRNTVPQQIKLSVDIRHPDENTLEAMEKEMRQVAIEEAKHADVDLKIDVIWRSSAVAFNQNCLNDIRRSVEVLGMPHIEMISGAGHDSVYVSKVAPTAMIFVPCERGISHNEAENADPAHLTAGTNVLFYTVLNSAKRIGVS